MSLGSSLFYSRDYVHSGELGKQIIGRIALGYFAAANKNDDMTAPYANGKWRFTGSKDDKTLYAFRLWSESERDLLVQTIPVKNPESVATVHIGIEKWLDWRRPS